MKILFFSNDFPGPHDPHKAVFNLRMCEGLAVRHDVRVVSPVAWTEHWPAARASAPQEAGSLDVAYPTYYFPPRIFLSERGRFMWWSLRRHLLSMTRTWRPDVILAYWAHPDGETALRWRAECGIPVVQVVGGSDIFLLRKDARRWSRVERVLRSADAVVTIGRHLAAAVMASGVPAHRVVGLHRPVDTDHFGPGSRIAARQHLGLPAEGRVLLWVGRFVPVKGLDVLIEAFAQLKNTIPAVTLCLVGDGPEMERIRLLTADAGLASSIRIAGPVAQDNLVHWYRAADATVLPSLSEGVPNVLLESIACGTPFVASDVGGVSEIADARLDRLVPPAQPGTLAAAMADLLTSPAAGVRAVMPCSPREFSQQLDVVFARVTNSMRQPAVAS